MRKIRLTVSILLTLVFIVFALLQYNDPDPLVWIALYLTVSIVAVFSLFKPLNIYFILPLILFYFVLAFYVWPPQYYGISKPMMDSRPEIEEARESLGLAIAGFSLIILYLVSFRSLPPFTKGR